jgi:amino acid transporter
MTDIQKIHSVITPEEIAMLNGSGGKGRQSGVDRGFRYRHMVLVFIAVLILGRLLFFPDLLTVDFNLPESMGDMSSYFQLRGAFAFALSVIYVFSYVKDWHYSRVAMIISSLSFAGMVSDFFNIYRFIGGALPPVVLVLVFARCVVIYCLFMNSVRDNRAPPMPRHLFS